MDPIELEELLARASTADAETRIELRDPIASYGPIAIDAMTDWIADPRLAGFAIRVLERIGRVETERARVIDVLAEVDRAELPPHIVRDLDEAMNALGRSIMKPSGRSRAPRASKPVAVAGVPGRGYWVMRTSPVERPYIWAEARAGRLRQGWGWNEEMNLDLIADLVARGSELSEKQRIAWRQRRMRTSAPDGIEIGDFVVAPNIPQWGRFSIFRVAGPYEYVLDAPRQFDERFGHILPVQLLASSIDRYGPLVSDALRAMTALQPRLYNITPYGGDVEKVVRAAPA